MALSDNEKTTLDRLHSRLRRDNQGYFVGGHRKLGFRALDAYYNGQQRLEQLGLSVPPELRRFVTIVNWPRIAVSALEERVDLEGFRLQGSADLDEDLWRVWQANNLDEESQLAHVDSLVYSRAFICVGTNSDDEQTPFVTVESPLEMTAEYSPRTRQLTAAAKFYADSSSGDRVLRATLYLPNVTIWLVSDGTSGWIEEERDEHNLGKLPVVMLAHRARTAERYGQSHLLDAVQITDAAARALTNAQIATETMAVPQRWALGVSKGDFVGPDGQPLTTWETYFGKVWASGNQDASFGQLSAANLSNFTEIVNHYGQLLSGSYGLPLRYFGQITTNPPSADGIRADESRLVKSAERFERAAEGAWESVMRLVRLFQTGEDDPSMTQLETVWRDPATPTLAEAADAAVKLYQAKVIPREGVWDVMGFSQPQREKYREAFKAELDDPIMREVLGSLSAPGPNAPPPAADARPGLPNAPAAAAVAVSPPPAV